MIETAKPGGFRNLWTRTATGVVLVAVALAALLAGQWAFWLLVALLAAAMAFEWAGLMRIADWRRWAAVIAILLVLGYAHPSWRAIDETSLFVLGVATIVLAVVTRSVRLAFGFAYIGLATLAILYLRESEQGLLLTFWTLAIVWATDIGAYFAGKTIGGPKLAPRLSPNKTWAGLIGGMASAALASYAFLSFAETGGWPFWLVPLAGLLALLAQSGDLYESWLKRRAGVKDSSNLLPGHGGALDRLDGLLPVAICVGALACAGMAP